MIGTIEQMVKDMEQKTPKITPKLDRELLTKYDGNHSLLYPILKDEIDQYNYPVEDNPFPWDFLFFEDDYLRYYLDILERKIPSKVVVDIGCGNGFQSYIFAYFDYIGIDCIKHKWFRDKGNYIKDFFWNLDMDFSDKIVISNMSLGYFNEWNGGITDEKIADKLKTCHWLYMGAPTTLIGLLKPYFCEIKYFENGGFPRVFLGK